MSYLKKIVLAQLVFGLTLSSTLFAQNKHSKETLYPTYKGLIMAGYQGWFHAPKEGIMYPDENRIHIDMLPDVNEYEKTYPTPFPFKERGVLYRYERLSSGV